MSQFYLSLDDFIIRIFGGDRVPFFRDILPIEDDEAIQHKMVANIIEAAQKKIEGQNFDIRKHVTDYDDVINRQRNVVYTRRKKVLLNDNFDWLKETEKSIYNAVLTTLINIRPPKNKKSKTDQDELKNAGSILKSILGLADFDTGVLEVLLKDHKFKYDKVARILAEKLNYQLKTRWEIYEPRIQAALARFVFLRAIDVLWTEHLVTVDHLQDSVRLRGYSQKDPLVEFKQDGMNIFVGLLDEIDKEVADTIFKVNPELVPAGILQS
jgi:preprotein translocase subunit SecA